MTCNCINENIQPVLDAGVDYYYHNHHPHCPHYFNEELPRLFYNQEENSRNPRRMRIPAPDKTKDIAALANLSAGQTQPIEFVCVNMTQAQFDKLHADKDTYHYAASYQGKE